MALNEVLPKNSEANIAREQIIILRYNMVYCLGIMPSGAVLLEFSEWPTSMSSKSAFN